tara:strand:- start:53982 stop:54515 length:534 start_codon:yes stop_codon:yes gene_type:complete
MRRQILILSMISLGFFGCELIDELTKFDMEFKQTVKIPPSTIINTPFDILLPPVETNSEATFGSNNTRKDLIEEIRLKSLDLTINSPSESDFSYLESIEIFISAEDLPEIKIAFKEEVSAAVGAELSLDVIGDDLKEYLKKDAFSIRLKTTLDESINEEQTIEVKSVFFVDAKILGV